MTPQCSVLQFISISCAYCLLGSYIIELKDWIRLKLTTKIEYRSLCGVTAAVITWHVYGEQGWWGHVTSDRYYRVQGCARTLTNSLHIRLL